MAEDLPDSFPFKGSQTLSELRSRSGRFGTPELRRIFVMTLLLAGALLVIAWQFSERAKEAAGPGGTPGGAPAVPLKEGTPLVQDDEANRAFSDVARIALEEASARVRAQVGVEDLLRGPEAHRGEWVRLSGIPIWMSADKLDPNAAGLAEVWRTYAVDRRTREAFCAWTTERPADWDAITLCHDIVECDGVFVRLVTYEAEDGRRRTAPLVIARTLRRVEAPPDTSVRSMEWAVVAMFGFVGLALLLLVRAGKREEARHRARLVEALREEPREGPPPAAGGNPA